MPDFKPPVSPAPKNDAPLTLTQDQFAELLRAAREVPIDPQKQKAEEALRRQARESAKRAAEIRKREQAKCSHRRKDWNGIAKYRIAWQRLATSEYIGVCLICNRTLREMELGTEEFNRLYAASAGTENVAEMPLHPDAVANYQAELAKWRTANTGK